MKRKARMMICIILVIFVFTGCRLAQENGGANAYDDRLVGIYLTTEHLDMFDYEGYFNDNRGDFNGGEITVNGNTQEYQGRLYATLKTKMLTNEETGEISETEEYVFEDIPGIAYYAPNISVMDEQDDVIDPISDTAITDGYVSIRYGDHENSVTQEGTIFVTPSNQDYIYYLNPIYQSADGSVYVTSGNGVSSQMTGEGETMSQTLNTSTTVTENGKTKAETTTIMLSVSVMFPPEKIIVLQMATDSELILRTEYVPDLMPDFFTMETNTAYFIVETYKRDSMGELKISREIYDSDVEYFDTFYVRADGICEKRWTQIK